MTAEDKCVKSLDQWLCWMEETRPEHEYDFGLERIRRVGEQLNLLKPAPFVITVGGTNGKGSTLATLEAILLAAGYKVGLFTSPHMLKYNERIRINGESVQDDWLCEAFERIDTARKTTWITYFEFSTLAAAHCFQRAAVDIALLEVGLGGRLDATNVIDPDVSVVTTVGLDHQELLGYSIEAIAKEKSGIFRPHKPAIFGDKPAPAAVTAMAARLDSPLYCRDEAFSLTTANEHWSWSGVDKQGQALTFNNLPIPRVVIDNAATAIQALQFLPQPVTADAIAGALSKVSVAGRFQQLSMCNPAGEAIDVILDVAHNPQAANRLRENLAKTAVAGRTLAVVAVCEDKDYLSVVDCLSTSVDAWNVAEFVSPRALDSTVLARQLQDRGYPVMRFDTVIDALNHALALASAGDRVIVTGSFMTVATALADINANNNK